MDYRPRAICLKMQGSLMLWKGGGGGGVCMSSMRIQMQKHGRVEADNKWSKGKKCEMWQGEGWEQ
jgi:hypothetical protein